MLMYLSCNNIDEKRSRLGAFDLIIQDFYFSSPTLFLHHLFDLNVV